MALLRRNTLLLPTSSNLLSSLSDIGLSSLSAKLDVLTRGEREEEEAENPPLSPIQKHGFREGGDGKCSGRLRNSKELSPRLIIDSSCSQNNAHSKRCLCTKFILTQLGQIVPRKVREMSQNRRSRRSVGHAAVGKCDRVHVGGHAAAAKSVSLECRWMSEQTNEGRNAYDEY